MTELLVLLLIILSIYLLRRVSQAERRSREFTDVILIHAHAANAPAPETDDLLQLFDFNAHFGQKAMFRFVPVTDRAMPDVTELYLCNGETSAKLHPDDTFDQRVSQINEFRDRITAAISSHTINQSVTESTSVEWHRNIARELNIFSKGSADRQVLIVSGDLQERSDLLDSSSDEGIRSLAASPKRVSKRLFSRCPIGKIRNVEVVFRYEPSCKEADIAFLNMAEVYMHMLIRLGATVSIQTTNKTYPA